MANTGFIRTETWKEFPATAGVGGVVAGELLKVGDTWGLPFKSVIESNKYAHIYACADMELPKAAGVSVLAGETCYLQPGETPVTVTNVNGGSDVKIGIFVRDADASDGYARADFQGGLA